MNRREFVGVCGAAAFLPLVKTESELVVVPIPPGLNKKDVEDWQNRPLKMWSNEIDYVIAESAEEATEIAAKLYGGLTPDEWDDDFKEFTGWFAMHEEQTFTFYDEDTDTTEKKSVSEYIKKYGKGYFACSEY